MTAKGNGVMMGCINSWVPGLLPVFFGFPFSQYCFFQVLSIVLSFPFVFTSFHSNTSEWTLGVHVLLSVSSYIPFFSTLPFKYFFPSFPFIPSPLQFSSTCLDAYSFSTSFISCRDTPVLHVWPVGAGVYGLLTSALWCSRSCCGGWDSLVIATADAAALFVVLAVAALLVVAGILVLSAL